MKWIAQKLVKKVFLHFLPIFDDISKWSGVLKAKNLDVEKNEEKLAFNPFLLNVTSKPKFSFKTDQHKILFTYYLAKPNI